MGKTCRDYSFGTSYCVHKLNRLRQTMNYILVNEQIAENFIIVKNPPNSGVLNSQSAGQLILCSHHLAHGAPHPSVGSCAGCSPVHYVGYTGRRGAPRVWYQLAGGGVRLSKACRSTPHHSYGLWGQNYEHR